MKASDIALINKKTGEIIEEHVVFIGRNPKYVDRGFIKLFVAFLPDLIENDEIAGKAIRLLFYMLERLDYDSLTIKIIPSDARKALKISKKTYHRWVNDLIRHGIIRKIDRYTYELKPYTFVKGSSAKALENAVEGREV